MPEKTSAGGLLDSLKRTFNLGPKKSPEAAAVPVVAAPAAEAAVETPAVAAVLEPAPMALSQPAIELPSAVVETPVLEAPPAAPGPDDRLPDWLQDREQGAVAPAPSAQVDTNWMEGGRAAAEELWPSAPM